MSDYKVQSVIIDKNKYTLQQAIEFLHRNNYKYPKVDITKNLYRFRQIEPAKLRKEGYTHYHTKQISPDISLVIAYRKA
jgi:hypothetical protein